MITSVATHLLSVNRYLRIARRNIPSKEAGGSIFLFAKDRVYSGKVGHISRVNISKKNKRRCQFDFMGNDESSGMGNGNAIYNFLRKSTFNQFISTRFPEGNDKVGGFSLIFSQI